MVQDLLLLLAISSVRSIQGTPVLLEALWAPPGRYYKMSGFKPSSTGKHPVFMAFAGTDDGYPTYIWSVIAYQMALRGFLSANIEYDNELQPMGSLEDVCLQLDPKSTAIYLGPTSALELLCKDHNADCSKGVAVAGYGQGGFIATYGLLKTTTVSAVLVMANAGVECMSVDNLKLSRSKRRMINAYDDWGASLGLLPVQETLLRMSKRESGYDCGNSLNCIQADGSGYYIVSSQDFRLVSCPNGSIGGPFFFGELENRKSNGTIQASTTFLCDFSKTSAPWGLTKNLDWLSQAASTKAAEILQEPLTYMGQPVSCSAECPPEDPMRKTIKSQQEAYQAHQPILESMHIVALVAVGVMSACCGIACVCAIISCLRVGKNEEESEDAYGSDDAALLSSEDSS